MGKLFINLNRNGYAGYCYLSTDGQVPACLPGEVLTIERFFTRLQPIRVDRSFFNDPILIFISK